MAVYSYSKLSTYEQCPGKYKLRYIDNIKPEIEHTIESFLGKAVHAALEYLYNQKMRGTLLALDDVMEYYANYWNEKYSDDFLIVKQGLTSEDYMNKGIHFLARYYVRHAPFADKTLAIEKKIFLSLRFDADLIGFVDRLSYNEKEDLYEVHDYKTGALKTQKQADVDRQLALYSLALKEEFKDGKDIRLIWHYLDHDELRISVRTDKQLRQLKKEILLMIDEIHEAEKRSTFPFMKSKLCSWCEFKNQCPEWTKQMTLSAFG